MPEIKPGTGVSISKRATAAYKKLYLTDRIKREIDDRNSSVEDEGRVVASGSGQADFRVCVGVVAFELLKMRWLSGCLSCPMAERLRVQFELAPFFQANNLCL